MAQLSLLQSFVADMQRLTRRHTTMKCYGLGLGLDTFRIVSLGENFRRLDPISVMNTYSRFVVITSQEATGHGVVQQSAHCSGQMWLITCTGCQHWCTARPVLMPYPSHMPFNPSPVHPLLLLAQLPLVKLGRGSVSVHHCCICWKACLRLTPPCQHLPPGSYHVPSQHDPPFHAGQASDCFCWTMMALWWIRQLLTTSPMLKC